MKQILILILIATSCTKECYECTQTMTSYGHSILLYNGVDTMVHYLPIEVEVEKFEKAFTYDLKRRWDGKLKSRFKCKKVKR